MTELLERLSGSMSLVLIGMSGLALLVVGFIATILLRAMKKTPEDVVGLGLPMPTAPAALPNIALPSAPALPSGVALPAGVAMPATPNIGGSLGQLQGLRGRLSGFSDRFGLRSSFRRSISAIKAYVPGSESRYRIPWILMLGPADSGKSTILANAGLRTAMRQNTTSSKAHWHFYDQGVVLDIAGDTLLGGGEDTPSDRGWGNVLRLLRAYRTERPIDGVVLALPATDLVGPERKIAAQLVQTASVLFQQFRIAQKKLGIRFPIYVLVTKCDRLSGFYSYCTELPQRLQDDIFGWSSHYALESAFSPTWVDEAVGSLYSELTRTQIELLAEKDSVADSDGVFRFPGEFQKLGEPLRAVLTEIFKDTAYHETFYFRGIYFTGDASETAQREQSALTLSADAPGMIPAAGAPRRPAFIKQLFEQKIFAEAGLAIPVRRTLLARNRAIFAMQVAMISLVLIGGLGLWWSSRRIENEAEPLMGLLTTLQSDFNTMNSASTDQAEQGRRVVSILTGMASVSSGRVWSLFMPTSWFSSINDEIADNLARAFQVVILPNFRDGMLRKLDETLASDPMRSGGSGDLMKDSEQLRDYLEALSEVGRNVERFNRLVEPGEADELDIQNIAALVPYIYGQQLPPSFVQNYRLYARALTRTNGTPITVADRPQYPSRTLTRAALSINDAYDNLFTTLDSLNERLENVSRAGSPGRYGVDTYRRLKNDIGQVQTVFTRSESFWLNPTVPVSGSLRQLLDSIPPTSVLGGKEFADRFTKVFNDIKREKLERYESRFASSTAGDAQITTDSARLALSQDVLTLQTALAELFKQRFMQTDPTSAPPVPQGVGQVPAWDPAPLDDALAAYTQYEEFVAKNVATFPPRLQQVVRFAAVQQLESSMNAAVSRAITYQPREDGFGVRGEERELRARVSNFAPAAKRLTRFLEIYEQLSLQDSYNGLASILAAQSAELLRSADRMLDQSRVYVPLNGNFSWWDGNTAATLTAFGVGAPEELEEYLARQRERIRFIGVNYATPVLAVTSSPGLLTYMRDQASVSQSQIVSRWQSIVQALDQYDQKVPGNSLAALEQFIRADLGVYVAPSCGTATRASSTPADYFLAIRARLRSDVAARCDDVSRAHAYAAYQRMTDFFHTRLAGHFPFAPAREASSADVADVRDFLASYAQFVQLNGPRYATTFPGAAEFLTRAETTRALFSPLLDADTIPAPMSFDATMLFRTERDREAGGDQIAEWSLTIGNQTVELGAPDAERKITWRPGVPVRLSLRWATESTLRPVADAGVRNAAIDGKRITFTYNDTWSLLRLIAAHSRVDGSDRQPHTLQFNVGTASAAVRGKTTQLVAGPGASVFVRLRIFHPLTKQELMFRSLPVDAPGF